MRQSTQEREWLGTALFAPIPSPRMERRRDWGVLRMSKKQLRTIILETRHARQHSWGCRDMARALLRPALLLLAVHSHIVVSLELDVEYPQTGNHSYVRLECTDGFTVVDPADFLVNDMVIRSDSSLVTVTASESSYIEFVFTQSQEGLFSCRSADEDSESIPLAGTYIANMKPPSSSTVCSVQGPV